MVLPVFGKDPSVASVAVVAVADRSIRFEAAGGLRKLDTVSSHGLTSTALASVALEQISPRKWIRLSQERCGQLSRLIVTLGMDTCAGTLHKE